MKKIKKYFAYIMLLICGNGPISKAQDYNFHDSMSRQQIELYLGKAMDVWNDELNLPGNDTLRRNVLQMCVDLNVRYITHLTGLWGGEYDAFSTGYLDHLAQNVHDLDSMYTSAGLVKPVIEAEIFEIVTPEVDSLEMNDEVAAAFGVTKRRFQYENMLDTSGFRVNYFGSGQSVPDITRQETRMYFYYLATEYIKRGIEALHMGQIELEDDNDFPNHDSTWSLYQMIRDYATTQNRGLVLLNAHTFGLYYIHNGDSTLLYDLHSYPMWPVGYGTVWADTSIYNNATVNGGDKVGGPAQLKYTACDIYGQARGGRTHWGWYADTLPYFVEFDLGGEDIPHLNTLYNTCYGAWGYDDCSWYSLQNEPYRNYWLRYALPQVKCLDRNGFVSVEGAHYHSWSAISGQHFFYAMTGYKNDESTIKEIWDGQVSGSIGNSEINSNTTWSSNKYVYNDVHITSGHTLTINNINDTTQAIIRMPKNGTIIVDSGAELIVNGAKITNSCDECFWQGIVTVGNTNLSQSTTHQGKVTLSGATIENATAGVCNHGADMNSAGGIIHAVNTHFLNCITGAKFDVYVHNLDYLTTPIAAYDAYFTGCTFEINDDYRGHSLGIPFYSLVAISGVQGVKFEGCAFYNRDHDAQNVGRGYGVYTYDGGCKFQSHCTSLTSPCTSWLRTKFTGFGSGIYATGTLSEWYTVWADGADFDSCTIGIKTDHFNNVTTTHSTFKVGDGLAQELFEAPGDCTQNVGIWESYSEVFGIEDNTFTGVTYSGQPSGMQDIGVIVEHSALTIDDQHNVPEWYKRSFHNEIYKDSFISLTKGCWAIGPNAAGYPDNSNDNGLVFKCNAFVSSDSAIVVRGAANEGVAYFQGGTDLSAGNTFSNSSGHSNYVKNSAYGFWYFYYGSTSGPEYPTVTPPPLISLITASADNACADHYVSIPLELTTKEAQKTLWNELKPRRDSLVLVYNALIDCGDTKGLWAYIDTMTNDSAIAVGHALLNCSPYLSREVMAHVANMDILSGTQLMHILNANPDLLHDPSLLDMLANDIPHPLSSGDITLLADSASNFTERSMKQSRIAGLSDSLGWIANVLITDMKTDTTCGDVDSIPVWLYKLHSERADYDVVGYYYGRDDLASGLAALDSIPSRYGFDSLLTSVVGEVESDIASNIDAGGSDTSSLYTGTGSTSTGASTWALSLTDGQIYEIVNFIGYQWIYTIVSNVKNSGRGLDSLTGGERDTLNALSTMAENTMHFKAGKIAQGILNHSSQWAYPCPQTAIITKGHKPGHTQNDTTTTTGNGLLDRLANAYTNKQGTKTDNRNKLPAKVNNVLKVYPNPANDHVVFDYGVPGTTGGLLLVISDTRGVKIKQFELGSSTGEVRWETKNVTAGIYFYQLMDAREVIKTGKVTVMR